MHIHIHGTMTQLLQIHYKVLRYSTSLIQDLHYIQVGKVNSNIYLVLQNNLHLHFSFMINFLTQGLTKVTPHQTPTTKPFFSMLIHRLGVKIITDLEPIVCKLSGVIIFRATNYVNLVVGHPSMLTQSLSLRFWGNFGVLFLSSFHSRNCRLKFKKYSNPKVIK